jgi:hypothetical protein
MNHSRQSTLSKQRSWILFVGTGFVRDHLLRDGHLSDLAGIPKNIYGEVGAANSQRVLRVCFVPDMNLQGERVAAEHPEGFKTLPQVCMRLLTCSTVYSRIYYTQRQGASSSCKPPMGSFSGKITEWPAHCLSRHGTGTFP